MTTKDQPSLRSLARGLGCTLRAVQKACEAGRLEGAVAKVDGRLVVIDAELAVTLWARNRTQVSQSKGGAEVAQPEVVPVEPEEGDDSERPPDEAWSLVDSQIRNNLASARTKELALRVREGELIERKTAEREAFSGARMVRDSLLNIPDRVSAELAGETDAAAVHAILDREIRQALQLATAEVEADAA